MKLSKLLAVPIALTLTTSFAIPALADRDDVIENVDDAIEVFQEIMGDSRTHIPSSLIGSSEAIAIIPNLVQGGFIVGGRHGNGLMFVREPDGFWSNPVFLNLTGGSFGLQFGGKSSDVVLLFRDQDAVNRVFNGDLKFGVDASGTAGPVGESAIDPTEFSEQILSYSRSEGLFGGVAVEGGTLKFDEDRNEDFYGRRNIKPNEIFDSNLQIPSDSARAISELQDAFGNYLTFAPVASSSSTSTTSVVTSSRQETHVVTGGETQVSSVFNLKKAQNAARQAIEEANGGLGRYQAEFSMHGPAQETPYVDNADGSWTFKFFGGRPGWTTPSVESVVTVFPSGTVRIDYNGPVR
jgi:lipid-binding SYLF domain-containing protein